MFFWDFFVTTGIQFWSLWTPSRKEEGEHTLWTPSRHFTTLNTPKINNKIKKSKNQPKSILSFRTGSLLIDYSMLFLKKSNVQFQHSDHSHFGCRMKTLAKHCRFGISPRRLHLFDWKSKRQKMSHYQTDFGRWNRCASQRPTISVHLRWDGTHKPALYIRSVLLLPLFLTSFVCLHVATFLTLSSDNRDNRACFN